MIIDFSTIIKKHDLKIKGIVHCGAHMAEESDTYQSFGVNNVVWIEANPTIYENCKNKLQNIDGNIVLNYSVWDEDGVELELNITNWTMSSSLLKLKEHKKWYPTVDVNSTIKVITKKLKTIYKECSIVKENYNFLMLDIQGCELRAIKGLEDYLSNIDYIYTEVNREELYEGCDIVEDIDNYLSQYGFERVETEWTFANWGDALYIKK